MKLLISIVLVFTSNTLAQHPEDLVSSDALAIVSIQNASAMQGSLNSISTEYVGTPIVDLLSQFIKNPTSIDFSEKILLSIEPAVSADGQGQKGMFGTMPHLVVICKPKKGKTLELNNFSGVNSSTMHDGWFIAAGGNSWSPPSSGKLSPIFSELPEGQVSLMVQFGKLWSQVGPATQMVGGMMIGQMNKPGPTGIIDPAQRKQTAATSQAFRKVMQFCAKVDTLSASVSLTRGVLDSTFKVGQKNPTEVIVDNASMIEMASSLKAKALQYAMSGDFTRSLLDLQPASLVSDLDLFPMSTMTEWMRVLATIQGDNVVMYGLEPKTGLTVTALAETSDPEEYLARVPAIIDAKSGQFSEEFQMKFTLSDKLPTTWDVSKVENTTADLQVMNAVIPDGTVLSFAQRGKWVGFMFGPIGYEPFTKSQNKTDLSRLLLAHDDMLIAFAMTVDLRDSARGFIAIAEQADSGDVTNVASGPSAITEITLGETLDGYALEINMDLDGTVKLISELD